MQEETSEERLECFVIDYEEILEGTEKSRQVSGSQCHTVTPPYARERVNP